MKHEDARHRILAVVRYWNLSEFIPASDDDVDPRLPRNDALLHVCLRHTEADGGKSGPSLLGEIQEAPCAAADV